MIIRPHYEGLFAVGEMLGWQVQRGWVVIRFVSPSDTST